MPQQSVLSKSVDVKVGTIRGVLDLLEPPQGSKMSLSGGEG